MRILARASNNSDWLSDTDFVILGLSNEELERIKNAQSKLKEHFPDENCRVHMYNIKAEVYSIDTLEYIEELKSFVKDFESDFIVLPTGFITDIPNSETLNDIRLETFLVVMKDCIRVMGFPSYDNSVEIYSADIVI